MAKAIFLDRDGVVNEAVFREGKLFVPVTPEEFRLCAEAPAALRDLKEMGFLLIVVTNQPDIAKGELTAADLERIHERMRAELPMLDDVLFCPHLDADQCACRKPKPGMILEAAAKWGVELRGSYAIGDRWRDIGAGAAAGCVTILKRTAYAKEVPADCVVNDLSEAAAFIRAHAKR